jgi:hypothetical protein
MGNDHNHDLAGVVLHAFLSQDVHNDLGASIKGRSQTTIMSQQDGPVSHVHSACANGAKESGDNSHERVLLLEPRTSGSLVVCHAHP